MSAARPGGAGRTAWEAVAALPAPDARVAAWAQGLDLPFAGQALWPTGARGARPVGGDAHVWGEPDGNRALVLGAPEVDAPDGGGARWRISVKGVGAWAPMFHDPPGDTAGSGRLLHAEAWFGESPWGAQGEAPALNGLAVSDEAGGVALAGMPICPVWQVVRLPESIVAGAAPARYRAYRGGWWQEHRLVPSTVRLFHHGAQVLEDGALAALSALGVADVGALDAFIDRLIATGLAALTLPARTAVDGPGGPTAYRWSHVWLDKDAVLAPDGALCFADLEGLERAPVAGPAALAALTQRHVDDHVYEWLYAVDRLLQVRWLGVLDPGARAGRRPSAVDAAADLALRIELALAADPFIEVVRRGTSVTLWVRPPAFPASPIPIALLTGPGPAGGAA